MAKLWQIWGFSQPKPAISLPSPANLRTMGTTNGQHQRDGIVIVGGGLAGQRCAETLRRDGYEGKIRLVCGEGHWPYDRPPLSKELLAGMRGEDSLAYRPPSWYERYSIDVLLGVRATGLRPVERRVNLSDHTTLNYDHALIATGCRARTLPFLAGYDNVSVLRTVDDSKGLRDVLSGRPRLAVVGAGFIGQEVAATARGLAAEVTMIEAAAFPLQGVLGTALGCWFAELHRAEGVGVITGCTVSRVEGNGLVQALHLSTGRRLEVDHVLVAVGVAPDTGWLADSGLDADQGIRVDEHGRTGFPTLMAAGDAARTFDPQLGAHVLGSHWEAAGNQGARAARAMLGLEPRPAPLSSFWTDQYGIRIQYVGHAQLADRIAFDGEPGLRHFTALFTRGGRVVAVLLVDRPRALPLARKLVEKGRKLKGIT
jgi:3-phenylpropionate/trans-cinnamate dioxygenase ferredoxin reductase subunit